MCSLSSQQVMENYEGDLTDILRGTGSGPTVSSDELITNWQFTSDTVSMDEQERHQQHQQQQGTDNFGDPFSIMGDPLLHDLDMPPDNNSSFFPNTSTTSSLEVGNNPSFKGTGGFIGSNSTSSSSIFGPAPAMNMNMNLDMDEIKRPANSMFTRMLQISPTSKLQISPCDSPVVGASPRGINSTPVMVNPNDMIISPSSLKGGLVDNSTTMQISSPRNPAIKRRKSQAKKVVCIPAPAATSGRPTGEVVPSDLWAWRKYGQKPIKGSPYPRGYYRCSSSKGCSARKQVERSRTDPNMLVITYTSEHNHPWPTQRNALAGSTRSQPSKNNNHNSNNNNSNNNNVVSKTLNQSLKHAALNNVKDEPSKETTTTPDDSNNNDNDSSPIIGQEPLAVKTETTEENASEYNHPEMDMDGGGNSSEYFAQTYKPTLMESDHQGDDFFAELGEIEADPLNILLYNHGFSTNQRSDLHKDGNNKTILDPFTDLLDWSSEDRNTTTSTLFGDPNRSL